MRRDHNNADTSMFIACCRGCVGGVILRRYGIVFRRLGKWHGSYDGRGRAIDLSFLGGCLGGLFWKKSS